MEWILLLKAKAHCSEVVPLGACSIPYGISKAGALVTPGCAICVTSHLFSMARDIVKYDT